MKKQVYIFALIICLVSVVANANGQKKGKVSKVRRVDISQEAQQQAERFWLERLTKCGQSYYAKSTIGDRIVEFSGVTVRVQPSTIDQVSAMNGYQFRGLMRLNFTANRDFIPKTKTWTDWSSVGRGDYARGIIKKNGKWNIENGSNFDGSNRITRIACADALNPTDYANRLQESNSKEQDYEMFRTAEKYGIFVSTDPTPPIDLYRSLYSSKNNGRAIRRVSFAPNGSWIYTMVESYPIGQGLSDSIKNKLGKVKIPSLIAFSPDDGWVIVHQDNGSHKTTPFYNNTSTELSEKLEELNNNKEDSIFEIWSLEIRGSKDWVVVFNYEKRGNDYPDWECWCSDDLQEALKKTNNLRQVVLSPSGGWLVISGKNDIDSFDIPQTLLDKLNELREQDRPIGRVVIAPDLSWIIY